jgi:hypothetical protein
MARSARCSWMKPRRTFKATTRPMARASALSPTARERRTAPRSKRTIRFRNWRKKMTKGPFLSGSDNWLGPKRRSLLRASSSSNPRERSVSPSGPSPALPGSGVLNRRPALPPGFQVNRPPK